MDSIPHIPSFGIPKSLGFSTPDSAYSITFNFRMQNRVLMNTVSETDLAPESWEARVRRLRLAFRGHVFSSRWTYRLQLSFSRGDMDWDASENNQVNSSPNPVRDAMLYYKVSRLLTVGFGQTKLPGNRQRVISSGALQFFDRSPVNANFTLDRDFGIFTESHLPLGKGVWVVKTAVSSGEGRNSTTSNAGLAYTGRMEWLPFGEFSAGGDYFEGDLSQEPKPKLSIAGGYHFNDLAVRTMGQTGTDLDSPRSFTTLFADVLLKYRGLAVSSEFIKRKAVTSALTGSGSGTSFLVTGRGINAQISYCFPSMWELAVRHSRVEAAQEVRNLMPDSEQTGFGLSRYLVRHRVKTQVNVFRQRFWPDRFPVKSSYFIAFQVELGI